MVSLKYDVWFRRVLIVFIIFGITSSVINLIHNRSLWFDESLLALNIVNKSYADLLIPLDYNQVAPVGFLFIEKFISELTGNHDWSLRIFPFSCYLASILLLYYLNLTLHRSKEISLLSVAFFCINCTVVYYSFEVKQYSTDVFIALLLLFIGFKLLEDSVKIKTVVIYSIIGIFSVFISNIAILLLITNTFMLLYKKYFQKRKFDYQIWVPIIFWLCSFFVYFHFFIYHHPSKRAMLRYWTQKDAFLPLNIFDSKFHHFIYGKIDMIFNTIIANGLFGWVYFIFFLLGLVLLFKIRKNLLVLVLPLFLHLLLSAFKIYPFHSRLILYLIPPLLTIISLSIYFIIQYFKQLKPAVYLIVITLLFINGYGLASLVPFEKEEVKKCMDYISKDPEKYENIYLYCSTDPVFKFYQNNYDCFNKKINYIHGDWHRDDWSSHMMELCLIKGDTWMIFSEVYYNNGKSEADFILNLLKSKGFSVIQSKKYFGAICFKVSLK